ncbi:MAG: pyridoxal-phosphate dependent enzyme [Bacteroidales bacterium]|nr:pyridoxal-phosphate dependent enzyme [Bacteroidales bacterium]
MNDIFEAAENIAPFAHITPVFTSQIINSVCGCKVYFKCENLQKAGAFKFRGATNALLNSKGKDKPVITHSSGNHAGALAKASAMLHRRCIVVMPETSPAVKVDAVKYYGATIVFCKPTLQAREDTTNRLISETGAELVHPYNNFYVIAGQGTATIEMLSTNPEIEVVIAPVGGGGLLSGTSIAAKGIKPFVKVYGAEPAGADDAYRSFKASKIIPSENPNTIADGLLTSLCDLTFEVIKKYTDNILTVSEESIVSAMKMIWQYLKIIVEPSGAVSLAAILDNKTVFSGKNAGLILSGGNIDLSRLPF